jgi:hypothetical protein
MSSLPRQSIGPLAVAQQRAINIRRTVACAYRGMFIEPLHGNDHVLLARAKVRRCVSRRSPTMHWSNPSHYCRSTCVCLLSGLFASGFPTKVLYVFRLCHAYYMPCPSHTPWLHRSNYIWGRVQGMKILIMQLSLEFHHFISLRSKHYPQRLVLKCP